MPKFPEKESDILVLANRMMAGYAAHAGDFPSIGGPGLAFRKRDFETARDAQVQARAAAQLATEEKLYRLNLLKEEIKNRLKKSAVDVADAPTKLTEIGWGPRQQPQPVVAPGQPKNLHPVAEGQAMLWLTWDRPDTGGPVRNYIIERRQRPEDGGEFGNWAIAGVTLNNEVHLTDQPRSIQMEYHIRAVNTASQSGPSNTVAIIL